jgi:hypothetical protein
MSAGPAGVAGRAWLADGLLAAGVLSCGVADGCDQEFHVLVVQAGNDLAEGDERAVGDAGGELQDALFPLQSSSHELHAVYIWSTHSRLAYLRRSTTGARYDNARAGGAGWDTRPC